MLYGYMLYDEESEYNCFIDDIDYYLYLINHYYDCDDYDNEENY